MEDTCRKYNRTFVHIQSIGRYDSIGAACRRESDKKCTVRWRFCIFHCPRPPTEGGGGESSTLLCPTATLLFDLFLLVTYHERNLQPLAEGEFCNGTSFCLRQEPVSSYTSIRSGQNNGRQLALSSVIPQGKQNQPCVVNGLVLQVRTYCAHYNIRKTTTNSSTIGLSLIHI